MEGHKREQAAAPPPQAAPLFKPTQDYILVLPVDRRISDVLHVISQEKHTQGTVVAVGPGKRSRKGVIRPLTVKSGDFITYGDLNRGYDFYPKYEEGGITYRILQEADVCFIADPDAPQHNLSDVEIFDLVEEAHVLEIKPFNERALTVTAGAESSS